MQEKCCGQLCAAITDRAFDSATSRRLGGDFSLAEIHRLYECHDKLLPNKTALFDHLTERWKTLFDAKFEVLLYDLTSTYFESNPPFPEDDKRKFGYSRDKRSDCPAAAGWSSH